MADAVLRSSDSGYRLRTPARTNLGSGQSGSLTYPYSGCRRNNNDTRAQPGIAPVASVENRDRQPTYRRPERPLDRQHSAVHAIHPIADNRSAEEAGQVTPPISGCRRVAVPNQGIEPEAPEPQCWLPRYPLPELCATTARSAPDRVHLR